MNWVVFGTGVVTVIAIYAIITLSLDLQFSYGNLINFGVVAYVAAGAYAYAILTQPPPTAFDDYRLGAGLPMPIGLLGAVAAGLAFGAITAWPSLRLRGEYVALTTFAFAEVFHSLLVNTRAVSNGLIGLIILRPFQSFLTADGQVLVFGLFVLAFLGAVYWLVRRTVDSPFGQVVLAISDDELGTRSIGKNVDRLRLQVFLLGSAISGLAGGLYAMYVTLVVPSLFAAELSFTVWIALVLGGVRKRSGALIGVIILIGFQELVRFIDLSPDRAALVSSLRLALTGALMVVVLKVRPPENVLTGAAAQPSQRSIIPRLRTRA
ncbi:MAG: branched-chain amino acid ABC transporter permease [Candidatus Velamenicoccus archaeovorus]